MPKSSGSKRNTRRKALRNWEDYPAIDMWADRQDMKNVHAWLRKIRTARNLVAGGTFVAAPVKLRQPRVSARGTAWLFLPLFAKHLA